MTFVKDRITEAIRFLQQHPGEKFIPEKIHEAIGGMGKYSSLERSLRRRVKPVEWKEASPLFIIEGQPIVPPTPALHRTKLLAANGQMVTHYYWGIKE